jgi:hypothetical protein
MSNPIIEVIASNENIQIGCGCVSLLLSICVFCATVTAIGLFVLSGIGAI